MFTTPCFIRKNTPELRKQLEELGYTNGAWEEPHFEYPYLMCFPNRKFGLFKGGGFYITEDDYRCDGKRWTYNPPKEYIDCGDLTLEITGPTINQKATNDKVKSYGWRRKKLLLARSFATFQKPMRQLTVFKKICE